MTDNGSQIIQSSAPDQLPQEDMALRRSLWNCPFEQIGDGGSDQVNHGDEIGIVPVSSGSGPSRLKQAVESLQSGT